MLGVLLLLSATDGFRCPDTGRIVSVGDRSVSVIRKCRAPDGRTSRTEVEKVKERVRRYRPNGVVYEEEIVREVQVQIEEWTYDFGPERFIRVLRFENDVLRRVDDGPYGTK